MRRKSLYIFALAAIAFAGCQKNEINPDYAVSDGIVKFVPSISGNGVMTKAQSSSSEETLDITLTSEDGTMSIPMTCETVEGIGSCNAKEVVTKGELINEFGPGPQPFDTDESFVVKAWDASTSGNIIPGTASGAYQTVSYIDSEWCTATSYYWREGENKTFFAYSNLPASGASITNTSIASQTLAYTVPSTASAQTDILMGSCTSDGKSGNPATMTGTASILFSHPLTAVQFKLGTIEGLTSFVVNSITIEGVYASGTAVMTPTTAAQSDPKDRFNWTPSGTKTVSQTVSTQPTASAPKIGEAFLLIPQTFTESSTARIVINCTIDGKTADLYYPLTSGNWKAGYTNTYTIGYSSHTYEYTFELEESSDATQSFNNTTSASTPVIIPLISTVSVDGGEDTDAEWTIKSVKVGNGADESVNASSFDNIGGLSAEITDGNILEITASERVAVDPSTHEYWAEGHGDWSPSDWSGNGVIDLSKYNFHDETTNNPMTTANCYIIRHAGTYKLPLVYGNAIVSGNENHCSYYPNYFKDIPDGDIRTESFDGSRPSGNFRLIHFQNHLGNDITSAFIENNMADESNYITASDVSIVWQDKAEVIKGLKIVGTPVYDGTYDNSSVRYLQFTVDQNVIRQSNAVIAVKDEEGRIMWSWHIWVTNNPTLLSNPISVTNYNDVEYKFSPFYGIGFIDELSYSARDIAQITLLQTDSNKEITITVNQPDLFSRADGVWYQYGRKDPFPINYTSIPGISIEFMESSFANSIMNPGCTAAHYDLGISTTTCFNLWTGKYSAFGNNWTGGPIDQSEIMIKAVYDPSPVGYKVPVSGAFTGFFKNEYEYNYNPTRDYFRTNDYSDFNDDKSIGYSNGYYFYTCKFDKVTSTTPTIYFPSLAPTDLSMFDQRDGVYFTANACFGCYSSFNFMAPNEYGGCLLSIMGDSDHPRGRSIRPVKE